MQHLMGHQVDTLVAHRRHSRSSDVEQRSIYGHW
jgi:hypothetical protein